MTRQSWLVDRLFLMLLEDVRNGAHRYERETRCGKIRHQRFFATEVTCPTSGLFVHVDCHSEMRRIANLGPGPFTGIRKAPRSESMRALACINN
jgi:hypothetical protein